MAGSVKIDLDKEPLGQNAQGDNIYLKDVWPSTAEIAEAVAKVDTAMFRKEYAAVFDGDATWQAIAVKESQTYDWNVDSTYIQHPPFFEHIAEPTRSIADITDARVLAVLGDSVTTDHISPAGNIKADSPAGRYLQEKGVAPIDFNSYGSRRGNHEVMMRGTFANIRIKNQIAPGTEGGYTTYWPTGEVTSIYDAAMKYKEDGTGLLVVAGKDYGMGSSRDWAAKGTNLLGIKAVIAESFERIHRSNLVLMGVLPLQFKDGESAETLGLVGNESFEIQIDKTVRPRDLVKVVATDADGNEKQFEVVARFDSEVEIDYYRHGGILQMVLREKIEESKVSN